MKNKFISSIRITFLCALGCFQVGHSAGDAPCHWFIVQIPNKTDRTELTDEEIESAISLAEQLADADIAQSIAPMNLAQNKWQISLLNTMMFP